MHTTNSTNAPRRAASAIRALTRMLLTAAFIFAPTAQPNAAAQEVRPREARAVPAGEVVVVLNEQLFNALLESLFALPQRPSFPLSGGGASEGRGGCASQITLEREVSGTRTAVRLRDGRFSAPVAFSGSYSAPLFGCLKFEGWADTELNLAFDPSRQALAARVEVRRVNLQKVPSMFSDGVTGLVQDALDKRINPIELLRAEQVSAQLPLRKLQAGGSLRLRAREVRHEVLPGELRLRIVYEFVRED